jgi:ATP-binding cassette subfamily B (MDR/TAP) protein 1
VTAIDIVKVYNGEDHEAFQFISAIKRSARFYFRQVLCNCGRMSYVKFWLILIFVVGFYLAVVLVKRGDLTPGNAITTFYAVLIAFESVETVGPQWLILGKGMAAGQALADLVNQDNDQLETSGWLRPSKCEGDIRMNHVSLVDSFLICDIG